MLNIAPPFLSQKKFKPKDIKVSDQQPLIKSYRCSPPYIKTETLCNFLFGKLTYRLTTKETANKKSTNKLDECLLLPH
jgi:hypothetical protein